MRVLKNRAGTSGLSTVCVVVYWPRNELACFKHHRRLLGRVSFNCILNPFYSAITMPSENMQAFISYTSELRAECDAVIEVCQEMKLTPFDYQRVSANSNSPRDVVERELTMSEIYLGIIGGRHGSVHPPPEDRSVVEFEFETFEKQGGLRLTAVFPKVLPPEEIEPLQQRFRSKFSGFTSRVWKRDFDSIEKLQIEVREAILTWLIRTNHPRKAAEEADVKKSLRTITLIAGILVALAALVAIIYVAVQPDFSNVIVAAMIACSSVAIVICILFVQLLL